MGSFKIGELAASAGVGRDTIRYYERIGLLPPAARSTAGYRLYQDGDLLRLNFIRSAQELGFSLEETKRLLNLHASDTTGALDALAITDAKIGQARLRLEELTRIRNVLEGLATHDVLDAQAADYPILSNLTPPRSAATGSPTALSVASIPPCKAHKQPARTTD